MCELLAMSCRYPARLTTSLHTLAMHTQVEGGCRDGWGVAYYQGKDVALYREVAPAAGSPQVGYLSTHAPATKLAVAYIRKASRGESSLANTGPFVRELGGRMHVFVHNGNLKTMDAPWVSGASRFQPVGNTDSEWAFCWLLDRMAQFHWADQVLPSVQQRLDAVASIADELRAMGLGPASFLYSDGDVLFAHADRRFHATTGLIAPPALYRFDCPADVAPELHHDCMLADGATLQQMQLIASEPLSAAPAWKPMARGEIVAVRAGEVVARTQL